MGSSYEALRMRSTLCITALLITFCCIILFAYKMCAVRLTKHCSAAAASDSLCLLHLLIASGGSADVLPYLDLCKHILWCSNSDETACGAVLQTRSQVSNSCAHSDRVRSRLWTFCLLFPAQHSVLNGGFEHHTMTIKSPCNHTQSKKVPHLLAELHKH